MRTNRFHARGLALAMGAALAAPLPTVAQQELPSYQADTVVVTTRRYPALRTEVPQKVEVITERDLRRTSADELADVLKEQAAVDVVQYPGLLSGVGIRGFRPEIGAINPRTLLLVDGRPAGTTNLSTLTLGAIERVEVLKGPASSLYGSSAMGGAVNVVTRRSTGAPGGSFSAAYGSFETLDLSGRGGGSLNAWLDADLGFSRFTRGEDYRTGEGSFFRSLVGSETATHLFFDGSMQPVEEKGDGEVRPNSRYGYASGFARLGARLGEAWRLDARWELFRADGVLTPPDLYSAYDQGGRKDLDWRSGDLTLTGTLGRHAPLLRVFASGEATDYFATWDPSPYVSYVGETESWGLQLQDAIWLGAHALTAGFDYTSAAASSRAFSGADAETGPYTPNAGTYSAALFGEGKLSFPGERLTATLGGRLDRVTLDVRETPLRPDVVAEEEEFTVFNPSAGLQYALPVGVRVHGTVGRAFVAPNAFNKAGLSLQKGFGGGGAVVTVGNPELEPERSLTWDAGVGISRPALGLDADVTYFRTRVDGRVTPAVAFFPAAGAPRTASGETVGTVVTYVNASEAAMEGIEWRVGYDLGALAEHRWSLRLFASATHLLTREETAQGVSVDAARFRGRTDFRPDEVLGALTFGGEATRGIYGVADATVNYGVELDDLRRFSARLTGRYVGDRLDQDFNHERFPDVRYPAFMTLDAVGTLRLADRWSASLLVDNLTDENYYEKRGFNLPGRQLRLRLTADF